MSEATEVPAPITVEELREVRGLLGIPEEELVWLAGACEPLERERGEILFEAGQPMEVMWIALRGAAQFIDVSDGPKLPSLMLRTGDISGRLPYSRMRISPGRGIAVEPIRAAVFPAARFGELAYHAPQTTERLVHSMLDRTRSLTHADAQREKLVGLGTMAAGLAHEINNPASAAQRSADELGSRLDRFGSIGSRLVRRVTRPLDEDGAIAAALDELETRLSARNDAEDHDLDPLTRSDREGDLATWLLDVGVADPWDAAAALVDAGLDRDAIAGPLGSLEADLRRDLAGWITWNAVLRRIGTELTHATGRISTLVAAMKSYTYMDQADRQTDIDVEKGIRDTITILGHRLRDRGATLHVDLPDLPRICGYGSELNQVWTNLIDNAASAAADGGGTVWVRGEHQGPAGAVIIEIRDDGPGIPPDVLRRIFEPFFTTKGVGEGTGLGLDIAHRIVVERHRGDIDVESRPGDTRFRVRLPIDGA